MTDEAVRGSKTDVADVEEAERLIEGVAESRPDQGSAMFDIWLMLLFASAGVFHHAGIKIPYFAFFHHDSGIRPLYARERRRLARRSG